MEYGLQMSGRKCQGMQNYNEKKIPEDIFLSDGWVI
jgi:hypothetical protein